MKAAAVLTAAVFLCALALVAYVTIPPWLDAQRIVREAEHDGRLDERAWQATLPVNFGEALMATEFAPPQSHPCDCWFLPTFSSGVVQVARHLDQRPPQRHLRRNLTELFTAMRLEDRYAAAQLADDYARLAYFGRSAYGAEAGAQAWFGKPLANLSDGEAAFLIGALDAPSRFNDPTRALAWRDRVIGRLRERGAWSAARAEAAQAEPMRLRPAA